MKILFFSFTLIYRLDNCGLYWEEHLMEKELKDVEEAMHGFDLS